MQRLIVARIDVHFVNALKLWASLYLLIWLALVQFLVTVVSGLPGVIYLHFIVGLAVLAVAIVNYRGLMRTSAPDRVKRISKVIPAMAAFDGLLGIPLYLFKEGTIHWAINVLHLIIAVAIITQASSAATAYDMWEEKEFN
jgi:Na+/citrate or Na+/malate symporter